MAPAADEREVDELAALLARLAAADTGLRVFGASGHRYQMEPPIPEPRLVAFEHEHGVRLPEDYRLFLSRVGGSGAGPDSGLLPLPSSFPDCRPGRPFPWTKAVFTADPSAIGLAPDAVEAGELDIDMLEDGLPGALLLAHEGCGYYAFLVVNGPSYGTVWNDWTAADCGLVPTGLTFGGWYRQWLLRCLSRLAREPLVDRIRPGMRMTAVVDLLGTDFVEQNGPTSRVLSYRDAAVAIFLDADGVVTGVVRLNV